MLVLQHLREGERGQKGERNNNAYFVALGRAAIGCPIKSPGERNKMNGVLLRSAGNWVTARPESLVSSWVKKGGAYLWGNSELTISGLSPGPEKA